MREKEVCVPVKKEKAELLEYIRKDMPMSVHQFAERLGMSPITYKKIVTFKPVKYQTIRLIDDYIAKLKEESKIK